MVKIARRRRLIAILLTAVFIILSSVNFSQIPSDILGSQKAPTAPVSSSEDLAINALGKLEVKGRAPQTGYAREQFGNGWAQNAGCDTRNIILNRDLNNVKSSNKCEVVSGELNDPYTGKVIIFNRGGETSDDVQIDHVVALSDAWQKGARQLTKARRVELANDPLELLAVDGEANLTKSNSDAASWLPPYKPFRCQYVARQVAVKVKYGLWITEAESNSIKSILVSCPSQTLPK